MFNTMTGVHSMYLGWCCYLKIMRHLHCEFPKLDQLGHSLLSLEMGDSLQ